MKTGLQSFRVRPATPADVPALLRLKRERAIAEGAEAAHRATEVEWLRDGFSERRRFTAFVAERVAVVIGVVACSERYYTGWAGSTLYVEDIYVEPARRRCGVGRALLCCVAALAVEQGNLFVELIVAESNPARRFYRRLGFERVLDRMNYIAAGAALAKLAAGAREPCERPRFPSMSAVSDAQAEVS